ncbi:MAG: SMC-Scp complex subunit ScpB [Gammaproteobacteria bacterium]|nr:SMC-Scp complex subunit ScpB [Gammaproteobacteria bacterium]
MEANQLKNIVEAALLAAGRPLDLDDLERLFPEGEAPPRAELRQALLALSGEYAGRGIELVEVGSGYRTQSRPDLADWVSRLWEERPSRYSRALLETLALIAYRQPITRAEIEDVRGVTIASSIMRTLVEREWVRVVGYRDVPGKPGMYGTTRKFLDYFGLKSLDDLPTLSELRDIDSINAELALEEDVPPQVDLDAFDPELREIAEAAAEAGGHGEADDSGHDADDHDSPARAGSPDAAGPEDDDAGDAAASGDAADRTRSESLH